MKLTTSDNFHCKLISFVSQDMFRNVQFLDHDWTTFDKKIETYVANNRRTIKSVANYFLATILTKTNGTMHFERPAYHCTLGTWPFETDCIYPILKSKVPLIEYDLYIIFTKFLSYSYISCYREAKLSFQLYTILSIRQFG